MTQTVSFGTASEIQVHVIGGRHPERNLEIEINQWLRENPLVEILDIKYGYAGEGTGYYTAMIIYR